MGEKGGILRLLHIYHSTSRVQGFGLILNLGQLGSEIFHHVHFKWTTCLQQRAEAVHFSHRIKWDPYPVHGFMSRGRVASAEALQVVWSSDLSAEFPALGSWRAVGSPLYT